MTWKYEMLPGQDTFPTAPPKPRDIFVNGEGAEIEFDEHVEYWVVTYRCKSFQAHFNACSKASVELLRLGWADRIIEQKILGPHVQLFYVEAKPDRRMADDEALIVGDDIRSMLAKDYTNQPYLVPSDVVAFYERHKLPPPRPRALALALLRPITQIEFFERQKASLRFDRKS